MTKKDKTEEIAYLREKITNSAFFYITDASSLSVEQVNKLRRLCFQRNIDIKVVKNTLVKKALEGEPIEKNYTPLFEKLHGPTALMFTDVANAPAKLLEEFRGKQLAKPEIKAAYIDSAIYFGDESLSILAKLKSKEELVGEIIGLLQSPGKNVISALTSSAGKLAGIVKTLQEKGA